MGMMGEGKGDFDLDKTVIKGEAEGEPFRGPYLVIVHGPHERMRFELQPGENVIGRGVGSTILLEDQSVSRRHARLVLGQDGITMEDLGSKNGTFVNGQRISERINIGHGDTIQIGIYTLRLATKPGLEETAQLPPDWEGRTMMMEAPPDEETYTMMGEEAEAKGPAESVEAGESEGPGEAAEEGIPEVPEEAPEGGRRPIWPKVLLYTLIPILMAGVATYIYLGPLHKRPPHFVERSLERLGLIEKKTTHTEAATPVKQPAVGQEKTSPPPEIEKKPTTIPVFLDFASSPLPAKVYLGDEEIGTTPINVQRMLEVGKKYEVKGKFFMEEIGETYIQDETVVAGENDSLIKVLFRGPIGMMKVDALPRGVDLYLEGYFIYDPFKAKTAKIENLIFGKPFYLPYGKYAIELRGESELAGSGEYIKDIKYRREVIISEENPIVELNITDKDLNEFPIEVISIPDKADVFIDATNVGKTPYSGVFPTGEHTLTLRKDGYFEYKQEIKMDKNIPVHLEIPLKTTAAGELINAAKLLMQNGMWGDAVAKLTKVFESNPTAGETAQARYLLGACYMNLGNQEAAEGYFRQALENEETRHPSLLGLATLLNAGGKREEAIPYLVEVLLNSTDPEVTKEAKLLFQKISPLRSILYITSDPQGARVYLNDQLRTETTPLIIPDVPLGTHRIRIEKDGYLPQEINKSLTINDFETIVVKLRPAS